MSSSRSPVSNPDPEPRPPASGGLWLRSGTYALLAAIAGGATLVWVLATGRALLYGDATAHLAIARRMVDSATPGLSQWGTVWLPLPHLLMAPLTLVPGWWKSGLAGSIPSWIALIVGAWLLHRIVMRLWGPPHWAAGAAAWAAVFFALNPSLLYLSAVPMTESIYLAAFLGLVERCGAFAERPSRAAAWAAGGWGLAASLVRYDGWFVLPFALAALWLASRWKRRLSTWAASWRFCLLAGTGPVFWFFYNAYYFKDPLAFARGPHSARQIYLDALRHGAGRYPGDHAIATAALYYLKTVTLTCGVPLMILALIGLLLWLSGVRRARPLALIEKPAAWLLLLPLPWYLWAMWSGNVPIFLPQYWPHGYYNLRYGVQLLPAVAAFSGLAAARVTPLAGRWLQSGAGLRASGRKLGIAAGLAIVCGAGYATMLRGEGPPAYAEAVHNAPGRQAMEHAIAHALSGWHRGERILMYFGNYPGAVADDGIPVRALVQESNYRLWQHALAAPQEGMSWVVLEQGGPAEAAINRTALQRYFVLAASLHAPGQPNVQVFRRNHQEQQER